jgi:hypothetical protein
MSCGCLAARRRRNWLASFPFIALATIIAALSMFVVYHFWSGLAVDVGHQASSPQEVFFGTEHRDPDVAQFTAPIEWIAAVFFILIALMFVGLGQVLGRAFDAYPDRIFGYTMNIGGSLAGIVGFSALSFVSRLLCRRCEEAPVPRLLLHLSQIGAAADGRRYAPDRINGADQSPDTLLLGSMLLFPGCLSSMAWTLTSYQLATRPGAASQPQRCDTSCLTSVTWKINF